MHVDYAQWVLALGRTSVVLAITAAALCILFALLRLRSPAARRLGCCAVLLQGWFVGQYTWELPVSMPSGHPPVLEALPWIASGPAVFEESAGLAEHRLPKSQPLSSPTSVLCVLLVVTWAGGMLLLIVGSAVSYAKFVQALPSGESDDSPWTEEWRQVQRHAGVNKEIPLQVTRCLGPLLCRLPGGYRLLIPEGLWQRLTRRQRFAILEHELAHYQRGDVWKSLVARILALPQWFNPLAWWAVRQFDLCAEWACDERACRSAREQAHDYARALLEIVSEPGSRPALQLLAGGSDLGRRVRRLLTLESKEDPMSKRMLVAICATLLCLVGLCRLEIRAKEPAELPASAADAAKPTAESTVSETRQSSLAQSDKEVIVDVAYLFKNLSYFKERQQQLKERVRTAEDSMKKKCRELRELRARLSAAKDDESTSRPLQQEIQRKSQAIEAERADLREGFRQQESDVYYEVYAMITREVSEYAKEHGIRVVRRANRPTHQEHEVDRHDPKSVLRMVNQEFLYFDHDEIDITQQILERLSRKPSNQSETEDP